MEMMRRILAEAERITEAMKASYLRRKKPLPIKPAEWEKVLRDSLKNEWMGGAVYLLVHVVVNGDGGSYPLGMTFTGTPERIAQELTLYSTLRDYSDVTEVAVEVRMVVRDRSLLDKFGADQDL
jgi:hypothetical protein